MDTVRELGWAVPWNPDLPFPEGLILFRPKDRCGKFADSIRGYSRALIQSLTEEVSNGR